MKNLKSIAIATAAIFVGLTSCTKDNNINEGPSIVEGTKNVTLLLDNGSKSLTRASDLTSASQKTTFTSGQVFFINGTTWDIKAVYNISSAASDIATGGSNVNITDLTTGAGVHFTNVDGDVVYVLGNKIVNGIVKGMNFKNMVLDVENGSEDLTDGLFTNAVLFGNAPIVRAGTDPDYTYSALVRIAPVAARIEIAKISEISGGANFTYHLEGIYVNNYYSKSTLGGETSLKQLWTNNSDLMSEYPGYEGTWFDRISSTTAEKTSSPATAGNVWAYNVYPAANLTDGDDNIPHIIVHLKQIEGISPVQTIANDLYLTISTYGGVKSFEAGKVYQIADLKFDVTKNGGDQIETQKFDVDVKVEILEWEPVVLTPDLN